MRFDITRQQLFGSLITLLLLVVCLIIRLSSGNFAPIETVEIDSILGKFICGLQGSYPKMSIIAFSLLTLYTAISVGRMGAKNSLFGDSCMLPISILALWLGSVSLNSCYLLSSILMVLFYLAITNIFSSVRIDDVTSRLFDAALYMGIMPLLYAPSIVLWVIIPLVLITLRRTYREAFASLIGLCVAPFAYLYIRWFQGDPFSESIDRFMETLTTHAHFELPTEVPIIRCVVCGAWLLIVGFGIFSAVTMEAPKRVKVRKTALILLTLSICSTALLPSFSPMLTISLASVCATLLATFSLMRLRGMVATIIYFVLIVLFVVALTLY